MANRLTDAYVVSLAASKEEQWAECSVGSAESALYRAQLSAKRGDPGADAQLAQAKHDHAAARKALHKAIDVAEIEFIKFKEIERELDEKRAKRHDAKARRVAREAQQLNGASTIV